MPRGAVRKPLGKQEVAVKRGRGRPPLPVDEDSAQILAQDFYAEGTNRRRVTDWRNFKTYVQRHLHHRRVYTSQDLRSYILALSRMEGKSRSSIQGTQRNILDFLELNHQHGRYEANVISDRINKISLRQAKNNVKVQTPN